MRPRQAHALANPLRRAVMVGDDPLGAYRATTRRGDLVVMTVLAVDI